MLCVCSVSVCSTILQFVHGPTMVIGRRTDVAIADRTLYLPNNVEHIAVSEGILHPTTGIDYFAIAGNQYPWHRVPDLVIGRPGYDNFLVATASLNNVAVVDATRTVVALHQTDAEGLGSGHRRNDSTYNRQIIRKYTAARHGCSRTDCTQYMTQLRDLVITSALTSRTTLPSQICRRRAIVVVLRPRRRR